MKLNTPWTHINYSVSSHHETKKHLFFPPTQNLDTIATLCAADFESQFQPLDMEWPVLFILQHDSMGLHQSYEVWITKNSAYTIKWQPLRRSNGHS